MKVKRFFISNLPLEVKETVQLTKEDYNYIVNVIRLKEGDNLILTNNTGYDFLCSILEINKKNVTIKVQEKTVNNNETNINLTVCQALVKKDNLELITQKITELGAKTLIPFTSQFTTVKQNTNKANRLQKIANSASSQCNRSKTLHVSSLTTLKNLPEKLINYDLVILAYEKQKSSLSEVLINNKNAKNIAIIIGSEGGFSKEEVELLKTKIKNLKVVGLGNRILRAETASISLTSIIMYQTGELS
jgi:16S rRNA (uracil1498-N3)-methyltransferase